MATPRKFSVYFVDCCMNFHHTKNKGDLGVLKAQADLCARGFLVCLPLSEHAPFDLVAYRDQIFRRVQVKTRSIRKGMLTVRFENSYSDSKGVRTKKVDKSAIDVYCVYCIDLDCCYYFRTSDFSSHRTINLRVNAPKNNQSKNIKWANDYREVP